MNLGLARQFLGIEIYRDEIGTRISLGQKAYITTILRSFGMEHSHGVSMPMVFWGYLGPMINTTSIRLNKAAYLNLPFPFLVFPKTQPLI